MSDFEPTILKEEPVPPYAEDCRRCELYTHGRRMIWGEGNPHAPIFILLDNPGLREDREGSPFVCGTRETLQYGMKKAGLALDLVYVSYILKHRPVRKYDKPLAREACSIHFRHQIAEKKPKLLFGLGNVVVQFLFPDSEEADVKTYRGRWHDYHGMPAAFSYHPLAVRRRPVLMNHFIEDLQLVRGKIDLLNE